MGIEVGINSWTLSETAFNPAALGKCEAIMCLGNGYLGLRSATEERYVGERRGLFVAGTFNKFDDNEVCELPNAADILEMEIVLNGHVFSLTQGEIKSYERKIDFSMAELIRDVEWVAPDGNIYKLVFLRVVSLDNLHVIAQRVYITPLSADAEITISTGINGQITNSGSQHFSEGAKRFYDRRYMQLVQTTTQSGIDFVFTTDVTLSQEASTHIAMDRRKIFSVYKTNVKKGQKLSIEKITTIYTSRDKECAVMTTEEIQALGLKSLKEQSYFAVIAKENATKWHELVWDNIPVTVESSNPRDQ